MMLGQTNTPTLAPVALNTQGCASGFYYSSIGPSGAGCYPNATPASCGPSGAYLKDPNGNILPNAIWLSAISAGGGILAFATGHPIIGALLAGFAFLNAPVFNCSQVSAGNLCAGFTECDTFMCRNGGCGF